MGFGKHIYTLRRLNIALALVCLGLIACDNFQAAQVGDLGSLSGDGTNPGNNGGLAVDPQIFDNFQSALAKNCNHCHGGPGSLFPAIANFAELTSQESWLNHPRNLVTPGNRASSAVYNRLTFAAGKVPNTNNNMPFAATNYPVTMTEEEAEAIGLYIDALGNALQVLKADVSNPFSSVAKAKFLVHGSAPTDLDFSQAIADSANGPTLNRQVLRDLVVFWLDTDAGRTKLDDFLRITLQQDEWSYPAGGHLLFGSIQPQGQGAGQNPFRSQWEKNLKDSFVRTAVDLVARDEPFTQVVTTRRVAVTTALLSSLSFADGAGRVEFTAATDLTFNNFMATNMVEADFNDWRYVTIATGVGIDYTNLNQLRAINDGATITLRAPRVGFFNQLGFQMRWPTNIVNDFRSTTSQTLLVAVNEMFEVGDATAEGNIDAIDQEHVAPGTACYQCHRLLDPIRESFAAHYDNFYRFSDGLDKRTSDFNFKGHRAPANSIPELASVIADHPKFAQGWVSRYCAYANSEPCDETDEEFLRLVQVFKDSNYNLKTTIGEILASPIVTSKGGGLEGQVVAVSAQALISSTRRNHLCHALNSRYRQVLTTKMRSYNLPNADLCQLNNDVSLATSSISKDTTTRGATGLTHSPDTNAFSFQAMEMFCRNLAVAVVTNDNQQGFDCCEADAVNDSIDSMVKFLMGLPTSHPRHQKVKEGLRSIYDYSANTANLTPLESLRETFVFACSSPDCGGGRTMSRRKLNSEQQLILKRREFIAGMFTAYGGLGLKSLLLGLPPGFIARRAMAATNPTYLIFSTRRQADPINTNVPGTYLPGIDHGDAFATPININMGGQFHQAAQPWSTLPVDLLAQTNFFHHATGSNAHNEAEKVLGSSGALASPSGSGSEMIPSAVCQHTSAILGTTTQKPIIIGDTSVSVQYGGTVQSRITPLALQRLMASRAANGSSAVAAFRDQQLDAIYGDLKQNGTKAQKEYLDRHLASRDEARKLGDQLGQLLSEVSGNDQRNVTLASLAALASGTSPVAVMGLTWGGDNHGDSLLTNEINQTTASIAEIGFMWDRLKALGLADKTTFAQLNVFGRTLRRNSRGGRDHNQLHSVMMMFGPKVNPGVTGGVVVRDDAKGGEAGGINSVNGTMSNPDITRDQTLASATKTLFKACGFDDNEITKRVSTGKVVNSAIKT